MLRGIAFVTQPFEVPSVVEAALAEQRRLGVARNVGGRLEHAEGAGAFRMRLALGNLFPVEVRHLLEEMHIVQHDRSVSTDGQRVAIARRGRTGPCR